MSDQRWQQQLAQSVDRTMARVYLTDPLLYAELLKVRRRLGADGVLGTSGEAPAARQAGVSRR